MKVVYVDSSIPLPSNVCLHTCNVCGCTFVWDENSRYIERAAGKGMAGYEIEFKTCSDDCRKGMRQSFIEWLSKHSPWDKKKAAENFDKYISKVLL